MEAQFKQNKINNIDLHIVVAECSSKYNLSSTIFPPIKPFRLVIIIYPNRNMLVPLLKIETCNISL